MAAAAAAAGVAAGCGFAASLRSHADGAVASVAAPGRPRRRLSTTARAAYVEDDGPTDEDMANVGLDDVFSLIEKATAADPEPAFAASRSGGGLSAIARWYKAYWLSVPPGVDVRRAYYGPSRPLYKGPNTTPQDVPPYLKGEYPGDYGCDLLRLCGDKDRYATLRAQELLNGRWAMLGVTGCLYPELSGIRGDGFEPVWFKTGAQIFKPEGIDYLGNPNLINAQSLLAVIAVQVLLMGAAEWLRAKGGAVGTDPLYPGGLFDPLGFAKDEEVLADLKVKEVKNGRLAMVAMAGLFAQGAVTGVGPIENLTTVLNL
eukprot:SM000008S22396  [mRNA]  locus=s8:1447336:1449303:- [translate_table: standard]